MKAIEYKGFLIEDCDGLMFIPFSKCPKIQITNLNDCDSQIIYAENLEEAKEIIKDIVEKSSTYFMELINECGEEKIINN